MLCSLFQLYDRVEGILSCSMQWRSTSMLLKFHISKISYQKHLHQMKGLSPDNFFFWSFSRKFMLLKFYISKTRKFFFTRNHRCFLKRESFFKINNSLFLINYNKVFSPFLVLPTLLGYSNSLNSSGCRLNSNFFLGFWRKFFHAKTNLIMKSFFPDKYTTIVSCQS